MMNCFTPQKIRFIAVLMALLLLSPVAFISFAPKGAQASVPTHCSIIDFNCIKEQFLDVALRATTRALMDAMIQQVVSWVQTGRGANVGYVLNYEETMRNFVGQRQNEFLAKMTAVFPQDPRLTTFFEVPRSLSQALTYSDLPNIDCNTLYNGSGLGELTRLSTQPRGCDKAGVIMTAMEQQRAFLASAMDSTKETQSANKGYLGFRKAVKICEDVDASGDPVCHTEYEAVTPGGLVADALSKGELSDFDWVISTDEISELIANLAAIAINQLINSAQGLF